MAFVLVEKVMELAPCSGASSLTDIPQILLQVFFLLLLDAITDKIFTALFGIVYNRIFLVIKQRS